MPGNQGKKQVPPQQQEKQPGRQSRMTPQPESERPAYRGSGKLANKIALITGGDSGIGRSVAILFAKEGADVVVVYYNEHEDAQETKRQVEQEGRRCLLMAGNIGEEKFCQEAIRKTIDEFHRLDVLVNNAAVQFPKESLQEISAEQLQTTFQTNIFSMFYITKAALPHLKEGSAIVNTSSVTAYRGSSHLLDYSSTKGAIVAFTRSLSLNLEKKKIRVNAVAPGPIWTPLIPASSDAQQVEKFGSDVPMERPGQPDEVAPCYVFLASEDSSYMSGQVLHPNGGSIING